MGDNVDVEAVELTELKESAPFSGFGSSSSSPPGQACHRPRPTGTWLHAGYHLTTGTAGASTPNLPAALASLGWGLGTFFLVFFAAASFYAYYLLILVLDRLYKHGERCHEYGEVSKKLIGRRWTICLISPLQFVVCFTTVVSFVLLGGQSLKATCYIYSQLYPKITLPMFIVVFGIISTILSQLPTFHSLRHLNLVSLIASLAYATLAVSGSILAHYSKNKPSTDYTLVGTPQEKVMNAVNGLSILSTIYGNALLTETQMVEEKMLFENFSSGQVDGVS